MRSYILFDAIEASLREASDYQVCRVEKPEDVARVSRELTPYALLLETTACPPYDLESRLAIRERVRGFAPECKIVLLCDENAEQLVAERVKQAKRDGLIDAFLYSSVSASYLAAVMDAL